MGNRRPGETRQLKQRSEAAGVRDGITGLGMAGLDWQPDSVQKHHGSTPKSLSVRVFPEDLAEEGTATVNVDSTCPPLGSYTVFLDYGLGPYSCCHVFPTSTGCPPKIQVKVNSSWLQSLWSEMKEVTDTGTDPLPAKSMTVSCALVAAGLL